MGGELLGGLEMKSVERLTVISKNGFSCTRAISLEITSKISIGDQPSSSLMLQYLYEFRNAVLVTI